MTISKTQSDASHFKRILFRLLAIFLGLVPLLVLEASLRWADWPRASEVKDPFVGFSEIRPLFVESRERGRYEIAEERLEFFRPDSFSVEKGKNEYRIFCLGGSTVQGRPFQIETAFTTWLELELKARDPNVDWRVVNCGGVSYASYRLLPILNEVLGYQPDLIIVYTGQNEFLEDRTYDGIKRTSPWLARTHSVLSPLKTYQAARGIWSGLTSERTGKQNSSEPLPAEVDALLDYEEGLKDYRRDDDWHAGVESHYQFNIRSMIDACQRVGTPIILSRPVVNLSDCPPFKSQFSKETSKEERARISRILDDPLAIEKEALAEQRKVLAELVDADPRYALSHHRLAECCLLLEAYDEAKESYLAAKDEDICPLRIKEVMDAALVQTASDASVALVDVRSWFETESDHGIVGREWMLDHVHPNIRGHQAIAHLFADELERQGILKSLDGWQSRRDESFQEQMESLDFAYYAHGQQRLEGLRRWTEGRAHGALSREDKKRSSQRTELVP